MYILFTQLIYRLFLDDILHYTFNRGSFRVIIERTKCSFFKKWQIEKDIQAEMFTGCTGELVLDDEKK